MGQLILSRQRDETIVIGDDIEVTVIDVRGDKVRLGIRAPKSTPVHRKEVADAIARKNRCAATEARVGALADVVAAAGVALGTEQREDGR